MSILARHFNAKYAALLYALPIQFTLAAIFIYLGTKDGTIQQLAHNSLFFILGFIVFIVVFYFLTKQLNFWLSLSLSYLIFIIVTLLILKLL